MRYLPILLLFFLSACKCKDGLTFLLDEEFKSYTDFPEGSWWVYEKVGDPSVTDSIYLYRRSERLAPPRGSCDEYQLFFYYLVRHQAKDIKEFSFVSEHYTDSTNYLRSGLWYGTQFLFTKKKGLDPLAQVETGIINGIVFDSTITFNHRSSYYFLSETYARRIGVVRRLYQDSSLYEIKKYFINH
ncbi:MAG TPA: hypothetical protein VGA21_00605 [Cyclobacteriaceae bacterium]